MKAPIVILSGPPGAGKTTLARHLAETAPGKAVHLHTEDFHRAIRKGFVAPWLEASHGQNLVVRDAIVAAASAYAAGGYEVMLDGVVGPWFLDAYRAASAAAGSSLDYVVLRPGKATAVAQARNRAESPMPDYPPGLYEKFADLGPLEPHAIDSAGRSVEALAEAVRSGLAEGRFRLG